MAAIFNENSNTIISGTNSDDSIYNFSAYVTINAGSGDDDIGNNWGETEYIDNAHHVLINSGSGDDIAFNISKFVTINGDEGADLIGNMASYIKINGGTGNDTIINSSNSNYVTIDGGAGNDSIVNEDGTSDTLIVDGGDGDDEIYNNGSDYVTINGGKGNDTIYTGGLYGVVTGGKGNDSIKFFASSYKTINFASGDGNDTLINYDSHDTINIISGTYSTQNSGNDVIIKVGSGSIKLVDAKNTKLNIKGTYADGSSTSTTSGGSSTSTTSGGGSSTNTSTSTTLTVTNTTASPVTVGSAIKTINASKRTTAVKIKGNTLANSIVGGSGADSLSGLAGADTLNGGKGNDTLTGGAGADVFFYTKGEGNDVITDYAVGDKVKITGAKVTKSSISGSDVILTVGTGKLTLKKAAGKKLSLYNNSNTLTNTVIGGAATVTLNDSSKTPATVASTVNIIDATKRTKAIKITGNSLANTIKGGSGVDSIYGGAGNDSILGNGGNDKLFGDAGNDTLTGGAGNDSLTGAAGNDKLLGDAGADTLVGGKGNDTLTGGAGADVFVYKSGDGNDTITDYTAQDKLRITGSYSTVKSGNNVIINVGSSKLTLKNAKDIKLNITKANNYEERWFTKDDTNFSSSDVSSILKSDNLISTDYNLSNELKLNQSSDITSLTYNQTQKK